MKKKIYYSLLVALFIILAFGLAYMLCVGAVLLVKTLLALGFKIFINVNIWYAGLLIWLVVGSIIGVRKVKKVLKENK